MACKEIVAGFFEARPKEATVCGANDRGGRLAVLRTRRPARAAEEWQLKIAIGTVARVVLRPNATTHTIGRIARKLPNVSSSRCAKFPRCQHAACWRLARYRDDSSSREKITVARLLKVAPADRFPYPSSTAEIARRPLTRSHRATWHCLAGKYPSQRATAAPS